MNRAMDRKAYYGILLLGFIGLIAACSGDENGVPDTTAPTVSGVNVANGSAMDLHGQVVITFSEPMDTGSLALGGTMAGESNGGVWSSITKASLEAATKGETDNNQLTVSPTSGWTTGNDQTLTVDAKDLAGNALQTLNLTYNVVKGIVYVSPGGDDGADGSLANPRKTIPAGISQADALGYHPGAVFVAGGTYQVDSGATAGTEVVLTEGISLYGGYTSDFIQRDAAANTTTIQDVSTDAASLTLPNRAIDAGSGVTTATFVDGFTIQGGGGDNSSGVFTHDGGSPTLIHDTIDGGAGGENSIGIYNASSSPSIENNTIDGGSSTIQSIGIYSVSSSPSIGNNTINGGSGGGFSQGIRNNSSSPSIQKNTVNGGSGGTSSVGIRNESSASPSIENNTIDGGTGGTNSYGLLNVSSSPSIENNTIDGGAGGTNSLGVSNQSSPSSLIRNNTINGGAGGSESWGIYNGSSNASIENNTIDGGVGADFSLGIRNDFSSPSIQNNIVFTSGSGVGRCIVEHDTSSDPVSVRNNDLFDCPTALYRDEGATDLTSIDLDKINALANASGNVSVDPAFVDIDGPDNDIKTMADNDWHLSSDSPAEVTQGGLDLSADFTTDKDGVTRTVPWSMGAYEHD